MRIMPPYFVSTAVFISAAAAIIASADGSNYLLVKLANNNARGENVERGGPPNQGPSTQVILYIGQSNLNTHLSQGLGIRLSSTVEAPGM